MKRILLIISILALAIVALLQAQASEVLNYQGVLKNPNGTVRPNAQAVITLEFVQDGVVIYSETHNISTNSNGYFSLHPGGGEATSGHFDDIDWGNGDIVMRSILDGTTIAETPLTAVPYALYAQSAKGMNELKASIDSIGEEHTQTLILYDNLLSDNNALWQANDTLYTYIDSLIIHIDHSLHTYIDQQKASTDSLLTAVSDSLYAEIRDTEEHIVSGINFFNATAQKPLPSGQYHTIQSAIEATPHTMRHSGTVVTFRCDSINWRSIQFTHIDTMLWNHTDLWQEFGYYGNLTIPYIENDSTTRLMIPEYVRRQGLIITYAKDNRIKNEQYIMPATDNATWCNDSSWLLLQADEEELRKMHDAIAEIDNRVNEVKKSQQDMATFGAWYYIDHNERFTQAGGIDNQGTSTPNYEMVHSDFIPINNNWFITTYGNKTFPGISFYRENNNRNRIPSKLDQIDSDAWEKQTFDFSTDAIPHGAQFFTVNMLLDKKEETAIKLRTPITDVIDQTPSYVYQVEDNHFIYIGAYVGSNGKRIINSQYRHSRFLPIADTHYKIYTTGKYTEESLVPTIVYYSDISFNYYITYDLGEVQDDRTTTREIIISPETAPEGATHFIVNCNPSLGESIIMTGITTNDIINDNRSRLDHLTDNQSCYTNRKLVTLGDSFTTNSGNKDKYWQQWLVDWMGLEWSKEETIDGMSGFAPMGYGGAWIMPNDINSMSIRCNDVKRYSPQIIVLYGGQNDKIDHYKLGSIDDTPFIPQQIIDLYNNTEVTSIESAIAYMEGRYSKTGNTIININVNERPRLYYLPDSAQWSDTKAWISPLDTISFYAAYKGIVERLCIENPYATIYCMTLMQCDETRYDNSLGEWSSVDTIRRTKNEAIKEIANYYGVQIIDLWNKSGITPYNASSNYHDWLHPNKYGYRRMAECIYRHLK